MEQSTNFNSMPSYDNSNFDPMMYDMYKDPMFNPMMQYEQSYMYYRALCMQLDYKIKCKEYENLYNSSSSARKVEQPRV